MTPEARKARPTWAKTGVRVVTRLPPFSMVTTQPVGVVHVLLAAKAAEDGLPEQARHRGLSGGSDDGAQESAGVAMKPLTIRLRDVA